MTIPEGATEVILSYVRRKAAEWTPDQLAQRVDAAVAELEAAARAVPAAALAERRAGEEWSPLDCIRHVAEVNSGTASRVRAVVLNGALPESAASAPPVSAGREAILAAHATVVAAATRAVRVGDGDPDAAITWLHPFLGDLNWREWFLTLRVHSLDHARQIAALRADE